MQRAGARVSWRVLQPRSIFHVAGREGRTLRLAESAGLWIQPHDLSRARERYAPGIDDRACTESAGRSASDYGIDLTRQQLSLSFPRILQYFSNSGQRRLASRIRSDQILRRIPTAGDECPVRRVRKRA